MTDAITSATDQAHAAGRVLKASEFPFEPNELLVAVTHRDVVIEALGTLGYQVGQPGDAVGAPETDDALGLSRLFLRDVSVEQMDAVLTELYKHFAAKYQNWVPTFGKNRIVGRVVGSGELSWGGDGVPKPAAQPSPWPAEWSGAGDGARVIVLDTPAAASSPLAGGWLDRRSDSFPANTPGAVTELVSASGHSTFVAGLILSQAPAATLKVTKVLNQQGYATAWEVAKAIVAAGLEGADVINLSLVCYTRDNMPPMAIAQAVSRLDPRIVVVAAAGNHGDNVDQEIARRPAWPAALPSVIAVGAATSDGVPDKITPRDVPWVDVLARGIDVTSSYVNDEVNVTDQDGRTTRARFKGYATWDGTSFAAGLVSGAVAAGIEPGRTTALASLRAVLAGAKRTVAGAPPFLELVVPE